VPLFVVLPNGEREYRLTARELEVGDVLRRNGDSWIVAEVTRGPDEASIVRLAPNTKTRSARAGESTGASRRTSLRASD
jgi:hypothetical protein